MGTKKASITIQYVEWLSDKYGQGSCTGAEWRYDRDSSAIKTTFTITTDKEKAIDAAVKFLRHHLAGEFDDSHWHDP